MSVIIDTVALQSSHCSSLPQIEIYWRPCSTDHHESEWDPYSRRWIACFPTSLFRAAVNMPAYHSVLQRLQLLLDCLTFFIKGISVTLATVSCCHKTRVSPWKLNSVVGSFCVFKWKRLHLQTETVSPHPSPHPHPFFFVILHSVHDDLISSPLVSQCCRAIGCHCRRRRFD